MLGRAYLSGVGIEKDELKGFDWISKSAEQKDTIAIYILGGCYENGLGVTADPQKAFQCYKEAVDMGYANALLQVARCYYKGIGVKQSYSDAFEWAKKACTKGIRDALAPVAYAYRQGEGTKKDLALALEYYTKAIELAEDNNGDLYFEMALCYNEMSKKSKAVEYYKKAADLGSARALYCLAICYGKGDGVKMDMEKCKSLLRKCANQNEDEEAKRLAKEVLNSIN